MTAHAKLSPSSAHRWISCPGSVKLAAQFPDEGSIYADEGTQAHTAGEIVCRHRFGHIDDAEKARLLNELETGPAASYDFVEIMLHAEQYGDFVEARAKETGAVLVYFEQRMDSGVEGVWGTSDVVLVSVDGVEIIDLKYGVGVRVDAWGNEQLRFYALGALRKYGDMFDDTKTVTYTVFQPRLDHVSTETISADDLRAWRDEVAVPQAAKAAAGVPEYSPSESTCRWCPAKGRCQAQVEQMAAIDFSIDPRGDLIQPADLGDLLVQAKQAAAWAKDVEEAAHKLAVDEHVEIPGWKVIRSQGKRGWTDHDAAMKAAVAAGHDLDDISEQPARKMKGIGVVEKIVGKDKFPKILAEFCPKGEGRPSLVPQDHPQAAIDRHAEAIADFF